MHVYVDVLACVVREEAHQCMFTEVGVCVCRVCVGTSGLLPKRVCFRVACVWWPSVRAHLCCLCACGVRVNDTSVHARLGMWTCVWRA